jgi:hypothetical protein
MTKKAFALAVGICLTAIIACGSANASSLRQGSSGAAVTGSVPGEVQWTYYQTLVLGQVCPPPPAPFEDVLCNTESFGDNIIRLVNPNGGANGNLAGAKPQTVCAMVYIFDDDEEMGECCGCPLSSAQLATFSVNQNLTANWGIQSPEVGTVGIADNGFGAIAIVATAPNALTSCLGQSAACNSGCDPTNIPGYSVTTTSNLLGSVSHNQAVQIGPSGSPLTLLGITETPLSDDSGGDPTNIIYLQNQCGALIGNGSQGGICNCPTE